MTTKHEPEGATAPTAAKGPTVPGAEAPVVTVPKGMEEPVTLVTSTAPPLGAEPEKPRPWTTQTPAPGAPADRAKADVPAGEYQPKSHR
jgi:hypothetical protein